MNDAPVTAPARGRTAIPALVRSRPRAALVAAIALLLLVLANDLLRNKADRLWAHPDQAIPVEVLKSMHIHGDLDTDWARAALPDVFRACRYNFSGYMLATYVAVTVASPQAFAADDALAAAIIRFSRWCAALTIALAFALAARNGGLVAGLAAALAVALLPQFYEDAHYPRPESLAALLSTGCLALATLRPSTASRRWALVALIAAIAGFLVSIKFTLAPVALFAAAPMLRLRGEHRPAAMLADWLRFAPVAAGAGVVGFAAGAPYVLADPGAYFEGIAALRAQYGGMHPPHSRAETGVAMQGGLIAHFYLAVLGLPAMLLYLLGQADRRLAPAQWLHALVLAVTVAGFLLQHVVFERNFSPLMPAFAIVMVQGIAFAARQVAGPAPGIARRVAASLVAVVLLVASLWRAAPITHALSTYFSATRMPAEQARRNAAVTAVIDTHGASERRDLAYPDAFSLHYPEPTAHCVLYVAHLFGDDWSIRFLRQMPPYLRVVAVDPSRFPSLPASTPQVYHSPSLVMFVQPSSCPGDRGRPTPP